MSDNSQVAHAEHGKGHHKLEMYLSGFVLSIILTLVAFFIVEKQLLPVYFRYLVVGLLAFIQAFIQVFYFVRSNTSRADGLWNVMAFLFSIFVIIILVGGSMWIMYNLNYNMVN
ncbi:MAG: cytochrome o ubiquinol oxidase subunit IV [Legionellales bacterium]|nr:cytochrome o ubiquinol oxidase subunit IV [Legionellales bacterium]